MSNIIFLEGNIQIGKSKIILNNIAHLQDEHMSGFFCQRLIKNTKTKAFCLVPANKAKTTSIEYRENIQNIFLEEKSGKWVRNDEVFRTRGIDFLSNTSTKRLILLDEIGGFEILINEFREKLYEVLTQGIPVIGVIKSVNNIVYMRKEVNIENDYITFYNKLRWDMVNAFGGKILNVNNNLTKSNDEILLFLHNNKLI